MAWRLANNNSSFIIVRSFFADAGGAFQWALGRQRLRDQVPGRDSLLAHIWKMLVVALHTLSYHF